MFGPLDAAVANAGLFRGAPTSVADALAGQMDDRVESLQVARCQRPVRMPGQLVARAGVASNESDNLVALPAQVFYDRRPDEAAGTADEDSHVRARLLAE